MLAFTHLMHRGTVFLRYAVGDVVSMQTDACPHCGRTSPRISSDSVRTGDVLKIKGTLVNLQVLKDSLERVRSIEEYQIVIQSADAADEHAMDELLIRLAVSRTRRRTLEPLSRMKRCGSPRSAPASSSCRGTTSSTRRRAPSRDGWKTVA